MFSRQSMNPASSANRKAPLLALVAALSIVAAGCAVSSNTALPLLPQAPTFSSGTFTISTNLVACPAGSTTANPLGQLCTVAGPNGPVDVMTDAFLGSPYTTTILTRGGSIPVTSCQIQGTIPTGVTLSASPAGNACVITGGLLSPLPGVTIPPGGFITISLTVRATDSGNPASSDTQDIIIRVFAGFSFTTTALENGTELRAYSKTVVSNLGGGIGVPPMTACTATGLPTGMSVAPSGSDCQISGTPTVNGTFTVTITGTDSAANTRSSAPYTLVINPPLVVNAPTFTNGTVGRPYTITAASTATTTGGQLPLTVCSGSGLPPGLLVAPNAANNACEISGTPTTAGTFNAVVISATDSATATTAAGTSNSVATSILINPPLTVPVFTIDNSTELRAFALTVPTAGGNRPLTACAIAGAPAGLVVAPDPANTAANVNNCLVSGTPAAGTAGNFNVTVSATDTATANTVSGSASSAATALQNNPVLAIPAFSFQTGAEGVSFTDTIPTTGGNRPLTACNAVGLPTGLTIALDPANTAVNVNNCIVSGSPAVGSAGPYNVVVDVTDTVSATTAAGAAASASTPLTVNGPLVIPPFVLGDGTEGRTFLQDIPVTGGIQPLTACVVSAGALPTGLTIGVSPTPGNCRITGMPGAGSAGAFNITIQATDTGAPPGTPPATATSAAAPFTINPALVVPAVVYGAGTELRPFSETITVTGGEQPLTSCSMAGIPAIGLTIALGPGVNQCTISGTPIAGSASNYTVVVSVTDTATTSTAAGNVSNAPGTSLVVNPPLAVSSILLANSVDGRAILPISIPITGGNPPYVSCSIAQTAAVGPGTTIGAGTTLTTAVVGTNCQITGSIAVGASGQTPPESQPTEFTTYTVAVTANDTASTSTAAGTANSAGMSWRINEPLNLFVAGTVTFDGVVGRPYNISFSPRTVGGNPTLFLSVPVGPFTETPVGSNVWIGNIGSPCEGLQIATGIISGTPINAGTAPGCDITLRVFDSANANTPSGFQDSVLAIDINPPLTIPAVAWGNGTDSRAFTQTFTVTGGLAPLTACNVSVGVLPSGLNLTLGPGAMECTISGTPAAGASGLSPYNFTLSANDSATTTTAAGTATGPAMNLVINPPLTVTNIVLAQSVSGRAILPFNVPISGGEQPYTSCTLSAGAGSGGGILGAGTTLTGLVSGTNCVVSGAVAATASPSVTTPNVGDDTQTYTLTVTATDSASTSTPAANASNTGMAWLINEAIEAAPVNGTTLGDAVVGRTFNVQIDVAGGIIGTIFGTVQAGNFGAPLLGISSGLAGTPCEGLTINLNTGLISGTPTFAAGGACNFIVRINDVANANTPAGLLDVSYALTVQPALTINSAVLNTGAPDAGTQGRAFTKTFTRTGGTGVGVTWSIAGAAVGTFFTAGGVGIAGTPCEGLSLNSGTGALTGTPPLAGTSGVCGPFDVRVDDGATNTVGSPISPTTPAGSAVQTNSVTINEELNIPALVASFDGTDGRLFNQQLPFTGGNAVFTCSATGLPGSNNLTAAFGGVNCQITGTPLTADVGSYLVNVTVQDTASTTTAAGSASTGNMAFDVNAALTITTTTLQGAAENVLYPSQNVLATGGEPPLTFSEVGANLGVGPCSGLALSAAGVVSGTPTTAGTCNFTVQVDDTATTSTVAGSATQALSIEVVTQITIAPWTSTEEDGTQNLLFGSGSGGAVLYPVAGGSGTFSCSTNPTLPTGMTIAVNGANCEIAGTPTVTAASTAYQVQATDSVSLQVASTTTAAFAIQPVLQLNGGVTTLFNAVEARTYSLLIASSGGTAPRTITNPGGDGTSLNTGDADCTNLVFAGITPDTIDGTAGPASVCSFNLQVDQTATTTTAGNSGSVGFLITINAPLTITTVQSGVIHGKANFTYAGMTFAATGGEGTFTWSDPSGNPTPCGALTGTLPTGLALNTGTAALTGTPTAASAALTDFEFQVCVADTGNAAVPAGSSIPPANALTGANNYRLNVMGHFAFVTADGGGADDVTKISTNIGANVANIAVTDGQPEGVAVSGDGRFAIVAQNADDIITQIDTISNAAVDSVVLTSGLACTSPNMVAAGKTAGGLYRAYIACGSGHVAVVDSTTRAIVAVVATPAPGGALFGAAMSPDGSKVYLTNPANDRFIVLDTAANTAAAGNMGAITCDSPQGIAFAPNGTLAYMACAGADRKLVEITVSSDTATNETANTIGTAGCDPDQVAVSLDSNRVYVTCGNQDEFSVVDATNLATVNDVTGLGANPVGVTVAPDATGVGRAYVVAGNNVRVYDDTLTPALTATGAGLAANPFAVTANARRIAYIPTPR